MVPRQGKMVVMGEEGGKDFWKLSLKEDGYVWCLLHIFKWHKNHTCASIFRSSRLYWRFQGELYPGIIWGTSSHPVIASLSLSGSPCFILNFILTFKHKVTPLEASAPSENGTRLAFPPEATSKPDKTYKAMILKTLGIMQWGIGIPERWETTEVSHSSLQKMESFHTMTKEGNPERVQLSLGLEEIELEVQGSQGSKEPERREEELRVSKESIQYLAEHQSSHVKEEIA